MSTAKHFSAEAIIDSKAIGSPDSGSILPRALWTRMIAGNIIVIGLAVAISIGVEHEVLEAGLEHHAVSWIHAALGIVTVLAFSWVSLGIMRQAVRHLEAFNSSSLERLGSTVARTTQQLTEALALNASLLDALQERIVVVNRQGTIIRANNTAREEAGENPEGRLFADVYASCNSNGERRSESRLIEYAFETRRSSRGRLIRGGAGCRRLLSVDAYPVFGASGRPQLVVEIVRDVTEDKDAQVQTQHREKMIALGMLAAGIAHDLGNPLASLSSELELLERDCAEISWREPLKVLKTHVDRIGRSLHEMVDFARRRTQTQQNAIVKEAVQDALRLLRHRQGSRQVTFSTELESNLPPVRIRDDDLVLILVNLLINALDAMPDGGEVRIEGRLSRSGEVLVQVTDTGTGMTDKVRRRALEALYTTKERGCGLGLSTCADTLHSIGGRLVLSSVPHRGTVASISLPVAPPVADHIRPVACEVTSA